MERSGCMDINLKPSLHPWPGPRRCFVGWIAKGPPPLKPHLAKIVDNNNGPMISQVNVHHARYLCSGGLFARARLGAVLIQEPSVLPS